MPTSSKRLRARAAAYQQAAEALLLDWTQDPVENGESTDLSEKLYQEVFRLEKLASLRAQKEQGYEHRRKQG